MLEHDTRFQTGEIVFNTVDLFNDGGIPDVDEGALLAASGSRGVIVKAGHIEAAPDVEIYLVRFEDEHGVLGVPVGCLVDELTQSLAQQA